MILNRVFLGGCLMFLSIGFSQEAPTKIDTTKIRQLEEVVITATRTVRQLSSLPLPVLLVGKKEISEINALRLSDILNEQTGLTIVRDHGEGIQMQGLDSDYTLILIDGVPLVGRTAGTLDLSRLTVGNIKQIEVVKGASSSLYGSEALAGVINIITEEPKKGFKGSVNLRLGTFNSSNTSTSLNFKKNSFGISFFANRFSNNGYDLDKSDVLKTVDPYVNYTFNAKLNYDFTNATTLLISGRYYTENQEAMPTLLLKGEGHVNEWNTHVKLHHKLNEKWSCYIDLYATRYKTDSYLNNMDNSLFNQSNYNQLLARPEVRFAYNPSNIQSFIGGIGWTYEALNRTYFSNKPVVNAPYVYMQYDVDITNKLNVIAGARFDKHNAYASQFSPKAAFRFEFNDKIAVKGSVGYGYKAPDFRQLFLDFTNPTAGYTVIGFNRVNSRIQELQHQGQILNLLVPISEFEGGLNPESSLSFNVGIQLKPFANLTLDLNMFRNNIRDLIDTRVIARKTNGQNVFSYQNISKVYTQGIEFNTVWRPTNLLKISGGYQLLIAKDRDAEESFKNGEVFIKESPGSPTIQLGRKDYLGLFKRSKHMLNAKLFYSIPKWKLSTNIRATYRSSYGMPDSNGNGYWDVYDGVVNGYTIIDLAINKNIYKSYQLGVGVDNLFHYKDPINISSLAGRLIHGKINIQF